MQLGSGNLTYPKGPISLPGCIAFFLEPRASKSTEDSTESLGSKISIIGALLYRKNYTNVLKCHEKY